MVAMSSAMRMGSWNGSNSAEMATMMLSVRARAALASTSGEHMNPSSAPWCSDTMTVAMPLSSHHETMSRYSRCNWAWVTSANGGTRSSNRQVNMAQTLVVKQGLLSLEDL